MKKLSLVFFLSFGLLAQAAQDPEQEFVQDATTAFDTALEQSEGADQRTESSLVPDLVAESGFEGLASSAEGYIPQVAGEQSEQVKNQENTQQEDANNAGQNSSASALKIKSHHTLSLLAGAATGAGFCHTVFGCENLPVINRALACAALVAPAAAVTALYKEKKDTVYKSRSIVGSTVLAYAGLVAGFYAELRRIMNGQAVESGDL